VCVLARKVVQTKLVVKLGSPPAQCKEYADLLISYFLANLETQKEKAGERGSSCTSSVVAAKARFLASARSFSPSSMGSCGRVAGSFIIAQGRIAALARGQRMDGSRQKRGASTR
jgi:hypothetical protein